MTGRPALGFAVGLLHSLNLQQLFVEGVLATEALSTAMAVLTATALLFALHRIRSGRPSGAIVTAIGILAAAAILVRPAVHLLRLAAACGRRVCGQGCDGPRAGRSGSPH